MTEPRAHISKWTWARVMAAYDFACATCREPFPDGARVDIDHIWQRAIGGPDAPDNYRPLCLGCHKAKSRDDAKARGKIRRLTGAPPPSASRPMADPARDKALSELVARVRGLTGPDRAVDRMLADIYAEAYVRTNMSAPGSSASPRATFLPP